MNTGLYPRVPPKSGLAILALVSWTAVAARSQPRPGPGSLPEFEVASIKAADATWTQLWPQRSGGRISWRARLSEIILYAYHLQSWQVSGLPSLGAPFQVDATADPAASTDEIRLMLQSLLLRRFNMSAQYETRQVVGYSLTVGKGGLKINQATSGGPPAPLPPWFAGNDVMIPQIEGKVFSSSPGKGIVAVTGRGVPITELAETLQGAIGTFVLDKTNVEGKYYFGFEFLSDDAPPDTDAPTLAEAIQGLGLVLEKERGPVKALVIGHIEKMPTEN